MATMSDEREAGSTGSGAGERTLLMRLPSDRRFRAVVETALRIYVRPICQGDEPAPRLQSELAEMIDEVAEGEPVEVVLSCRRPALEITVRSGGRRRSRRWQIRPGGAPEAL
jgi:hypothetical protein